MTITYLAGFRHDSAVSPADTAWLARWLATTPGLARGLIYTPAATHDPYLDDGRPPALVLQLYFPGIAALESALARDGCLQALAAPDALPSLRGADVTQQAMLARDFPAPEPAGADGTSCAYVVAYEGAAEDLNAFVSHYVASHTAVMARFPGIREIEVCTRIDWCGFLPWPRANAMLRNKVVFDDPAALTAALNSPARHEMREDFKLFPAFTGPVTHYPMLARALPIGA
jgi:hypothetical protein